MSLETTAWAYRQRLRPHEKLLLILLADDSTDTNAEDLRNHGIFASTTDDELSAKGGFTAHEIEIAAHGLIKASLIEPAPSPWRWRLRTDQGIPEPPRTPWPIKIVVRPHFVYVATGGHGLTKIGIASNIQNRMRSISLAAGTSVALFESWSGPQAWCRKVERVALDALSDSVAYGEWFRIEPERARDMIAEIILRPTLADRV